MKLSVVKFQVPKDGGTVPCKAVFGDGVFPYIHLAYVPDAWIPRWYHVDTTLIPPLRYPNRVDVYAPAGAPLGFFWKDQRPKGVLSVNIKWVVGKMWGNSLLAHQIVWFFDRVFWVMLLWRSKRTLTEFKLLSIQLCLETWLKFLGKPFRHEMTEMYSPENSRTSPEKGPFEKENSSEPIIIFQGIFLSFHGCISTYHHKQMNFHDVLHWMLHSSRPIDKKQVLQKALRMHHGPWFHCKHTKEQQKQSTYGDVWSFGLYGRWISLVTQDSILSHGTVAFP